MKRTRTLLAAALVSCLSAVNAMAFDQLRADGVDMGRAGSLKENSQVTVTVALNLSNRAELEQLVQSVYTRGSPSYHQFLTPQQFRQRFGPSPATIAAVTKHFQSLGLTVSQTAAAQLHVTGTAEAIGRAFAVELHAYQVPATSSGPAFRYRAPVGDSKIPTAVAASVHSVLGLDTRPRYAPHSRRAPTRFQAKNSAPNTPNAPGDWTVQDFAIYYDVNPLYKKGLDGKGQTVGIVTLASFTPSDAFSYWNSLGLDVKANRIKEVQIDGGSGPPSDASGSDETTLDVQQSGGLAPGAKILVYEAPNTDQGFVDAFAAAIDSNQADTISTSWGEWEYLTGSADIADGPVINPVTRRHTTSMQAEDDLFIQAALQGQSMYAASGDCGALDAYEIFTPPDFSNVLAIDDPGSQRFMTSAGGTTLPGKQKFGGGLNVNIAQEQAWGWDYLIPICAAQGFDPVSCGIFPGGGGGGVSVLTQRPFYQAGIAGMRNSVKNQSLLDLTQNPPVDLADLPGNFAGRNVPDISLNADPDTGYILPYTSDQTGFSVEEFGGGTSFVAPQLNGITALYAQALGHRVGLLNVPLYQLLRSGNPYTGNKAPLRDITQGDNWFFDANKAYDQATGVGVPDVANLLEALKNLE
ncbi:MAG TPA: S53 family peptidase [Steroidobacteraceae bacterium]|nr:S53 family peptidase [Steroidobacteraceae bacterium]